MAEIIINPEAALSAIKERLNAEMLKAAEPLVQAAVKAIEVAMRERLAAHLIAYMDKSYSIARHGQDLHIIVRRDAEKD